MTREEILKMGAGESLDDLVAKKVMGWHRVTHLGITAWVDDNNIIGAEGFGWHPSTDISTAMQIMEKLKKGWDCITLLWDVGAWDIILESYDTGVTFFLRKESGLTYEELPEAICKAALLAMLEARSV